MLVVEQLTPDQEIVDQVGHPNQSVIEDDFGVRWLLVSSSGSIPSHVWDRAALLGVMALLRPEGAGYAVALADELPEATRGQIFVPTSGWKIFDHIPNLITEVIAATEVATEEELTPEDVGLVLIHNHSEYSLLDGLPRTDEIAKKVKSDGARYVGVADHGNVAAHPDLQASCDEHGLKPVFALEAYFVDDRRKSLADFPHPEPDKTDQGAVKRYKDLREQYVKELNDYWHLVLVATNQTGLQNLWAMSTEAYRTGMRGKNARLDWEVLEQYSEGVICTTACLRGPILHNGVLDGKEDQALLRLARLKEIFGERLYLEIHTNTLPQQIEANQALVRLGKAFDVPLVVAVDAHYVSKEDVRAHRVWLSIQTNRDINDDSTLFQGEPDYYLMDEAEVRAALNYLPEEAVTESILSTAEIALQATARIDGKPTPPIFSKGGKEEDDQRLYDLCMSNWSKVLGKRYPEAVYIKRFAREFALISGKSFSGYFLMTADMTNYARDNGILVGPGRGSGAGCLVAYLANIVDVDPVDAELIFERFMTEGRTELPDFDIDYPASKKQVMQAYVRERYGDDQVTVVGSVLRLKSKGIIDKLATATRSELPEDFGVDHDALRAIITNAEADTAGLGMKWSKLNSVFEEELAPFRDKYPGFFQMADQLVERVNTFGQHAAGMVVSTGKALSTGLPMRRAKEDGHMVSQFDKDVLEKLGFVKFDLLTIRNLDTIQETINLIKETTGQQIDVYDWREEYEDPQVWDEISQAHTLGLFQIETALGTQYAARMRPQQLSDLADLVTIVRPGPRNSGLTESYIKRRDGEEEITYLDPRMESFLSKTFGCMLYQEDIMQCCIVLAGYSSNEADKVRKILGKKKVAQVEAAGQEFVPRAVAHGMSQQDAEILWTQMAEFSRYCVTGETTIQLAGAGRYSTGSMRVDELYRRINAPLLSPGNKGAYRKYDGPCVVCGKDTGGPWTRGACRPCYVWRQKFRDVNRGVRGLTVEADGRIRPCRILMVHKHEAAQTWRVTLRDGKSITATANHKHLTPEGLRRVDELSVGDHLVVDGGYEVHRYEKDEYRTTTGERQGAGTVNGAYGQENFGFIDGGYGQLMAWTAQAPDHCEECEHDGSQYRLERAHLDGDRSNNDWSNLKMLCVSCHKRHDYAFNGRRRRYGKGRLTTTSEIVSIEKAQVEDVYSVVMDDPHIWIANGGIATANSFNRAHAYSYAVLAFWCGWLKYHYPVQYLTSILSTVDKDKIPAFVEEARRMGYQVLPPDINASKHGFTAEKLAVRYGIDSIKNIGEAVADAIVQEREERGLFTSFDDFMERMVLPKGSSVNRGNVAHLAHIGAFDSLVPNRRGLETILQAEKDGTAARCVFKVDTIPVGAPNDLPCIFDWDSEPAPVNPRTGKKGKKKPPPKKCTKACRNYTAPPPPKIEDIEPYQPMDIGEIEQETLGVYLTVTPFDTLPEDLRDEFRHQAEQAVNPTGPQGIYTLPGVIVKRRPYEDRSGRKMGFFDLKLEIGTIGVTLFSSEWERYEESAKLGRLVLVELSRNSRGFTLRGMNLL